MTEVGAGAAAGFWAAGVSAPQEGWGLTPRVSEVRLGTAVNGVMTRQASPSAREAARRVPSGLTVDDMILPSSMTERVP
ncbi:hypothetical protein AQJ58_26020 [Streptomyces sp. DSM 15324]|nr:hypothetical protein AQJ58_26020 [Streptomyces sp. DSM 15324]